MKEFYPTERFSKSYKNAPPRIQRAFKKQSLFLLRDIHYPSLHAKKLEGAGDIWQARVTRGWRFYFQIEKDVYLLLDIITHPK